jgi:hypothetical protein
MFGTREPKLKPLNDDLRHWTGEIMKAVKPDRLRSDVGLLLGPRNRLHSPAAMAQAGEIIAQDFKMSGWEVQEQSFEVENVMGCLDYGAGLLPPGVIPTLYPHLCGSNIVAIKPGLASKETLIIGAHFDTIRDSPGADDNTASVAALLELARVLGPCVFERSVVLAALDMEEIGFFGSKALVKQFSQDWKIDGAIVFESIAYTATDPGTQEVPPRIGRLYPGQTRKIKDREFVGDWTLVLYQKSSALLARSFAEGLAYTSGPQTPIMMRDPMDIHWLRRVIKRMIPSALGFGRSDHISFWEAGIPAIMISDTANFRNPHYHQPTDTPETLDYERVAAIVGATAVTIARLAGLVKTENSKVDS